MSLDHQKSLRSVLFLSRHAKNLVQDCADEYQNLIESIVEPLLEKKPSNPDRSSSTRSSVCGHRLPGNREDKGLCSSTMSLDENLPSSLESRDGGEESFISVITGDTDIVEASESHTESNDYTDCDVVIDEERSDSNYTIDAGGMESSYDHFTEEEISDHDSEILHTKCDANLYDGRSSGGRALVGLINVINDNSGESHFAITIIVAYQL